MSDQLPIACNLSEMDEDELERHHRNAEAVFGSVHGIREISGGYKFRLPPDTAIIKRAGAFIARERLCCPFIEFTLKIPSGGKPVWLKLAGRKGVKSFIKKTLLSRLDIPNKP